MERRRVLVTGAAGFVGRAVFDRYRDAGVEVVGLDVSPDADAGIVAADLATPGPWQDTVAGCDLVVHTAAVVSNVATRDAAWAVNVVGTHHVLEAADPATRVVCFSSSAVYSPQRPDFVDERHPVRPTGRVYGDSKIAAEVVALQALAAGDADVVILRPGDVYGPRSRPWTLIPIEALRAGRLVLPAHGRGIVDAVYVDDLVECVVCAGAASDPVGRVYNAGGGAPVEASVFFGEYARRLGLRAPRCTSTRVAAAVADAVGRAQRLRGRPSELSAASVAMLAKTGGMSIARAGRELGWEPRVGLDDGMTRTIAALAR